MRALPTLVLAISLSLYSSLGRAQHSNEAAVQKELDQAWSEDQRRRWYDSTQGSRLIPETWFRALEQPGNSTSLFLDESHIASLGYLPRANSQVSIQPLPIGFVIDRGPDDDLERTRLRWKAKQRGDEPWVGFNCAACHTSKLTYRSKHLTIDGGPSVSNFQTFMRAFNSALRETYDDSAKWQRFVDRVRVLERAKVTKTVAEEVQLDPARLRSQYKLLLDWQLREAAVNQAEIEYGPGRIDAFGHIYNKIVLLLDREKGKGNPSDAPVSIPFIWRAPQYDRVQYNGIAPKVTVAGVDVGAVGRNTGEVIGVFGDVVVTSSPLQGFTSSIKVRNLVGLEATLAALRPPAWPASVLGEIDPKGSTAPSGKPWSLLGQEIYKKRCESCHEVMPRNKLKNRVVAKMSKLDGSPADEKSTEKTIPPGTDVWMACNAFARKTTSGTLKGYKSILLTEGRTLPEEHVISDLLRTVVSGVILDHKLTLTRVAAENLIGLTPQPQPEFAPSLPTPPVGGRSAEKQRQFDLCMSSSSDYLGYTAKPLNGVWATAPFLHNGSVPTIYDLLLPPKDRPSRFYLGTREYDPEKLGFVYVISKASDSKSLETEAAENRKLGNTFRFNTRSGSIPLDGNSNEGHDYDNASLSDDDRRALIAYLKRL